ncbi:DMT family transporter [uncultured Thiothrix sp.]|uniref:DMT family transporter n=1 Tax=uncultured Thiothrix sp. TaxID=223185 RepID=UPI002603B5B8|nr:DMT family transporter [uncultured Thiothrix sp.]
MRGIVLTLIALFFFASMDTTIKYLAESYNIPLIVAIRYIVNTLFIVAIFAPRQGKTLIKTQRTGLVLIRAASLTIMSLLVGFALKVMPVAEMIAISFLSPLLVALLARPLLGETIGFLGWLATLVGFTGVMFIAQPGNGLATSGIMLMLLAVIVNTFYQLLSRLLAASETTLALLFYASFFGALVFGLTLPWAWYGMKPSHLQLVLFISTGITGGIGHYLFTAAYRYAPATVIAPITYFQLLWAGLFGWLVFNHVPSSWSILGMILVIASGFIMMLKTRQPVPSKAA